MTTFIQLHFLTSYPPSNLNRDDLGRPKTAKMGGTDRLRVSSQSLKRHWRTSNLFEEAMNEHIGKRTKRLGVKVHEKLIAGGMAKDQAKTAATAIATVFGKENKKRAFEIEQLVHVSPLERENIDNLVETLLTEKRAPTEDELNLLTHERMAVDIALFGRMLASKPAFNVEAACQVSHALSVHSVVVDSDYFTAVDDLNDGSEDRGSAHIGEAGFAAALFYQYVCIDRDLLIENLNGNEDLANRAIRALVETTVKIPPSGKQNSFASRAYASYLLAEKGTQQPRSLSVAFLQALRDDNMLQAAITQLESQRDNFDAIYGSCSDASASFNVLEQTGSLKNVLDFVSQHGA